MLQGVLLLLSLFVFFIFNVSCAVNMARSSQMPAEKPANKALAHAGVNTVSPSDASGKTGSLLRSSRSSNPSQLLSDLHSLADKESLDRVDARVSMHREANEG
ncbi:MAG: hypothetical protein ACI8WB_002424 [Phenylobacterium sp.]|jgi:hypothetical protein